MKCVWMVAFMTCCFSVLSAANHSLSLERRFLWRPGLIFHLRLQPVGGQRAHSGESLQRWTVSLLNEKSLLGVSSVIPILTGKTKKMLVVLAVEKQAGANTHRIPGNVYDVHAVRRIFNPTSVHREEYQSHNQKKQKTSLRAVVDHNLSENVRKN